MKVKYYFRKKKYEPIKELREYIKTTVLKRIFRKDKK
jgi:hypothetical protein